MAISENQNVDFSVSENQNADDSTMPTSQNQNAEDTGIKLKGKFMTTEKLIHTLTSEKTTHTEVPNPIKENVYFVLDHKDNLDRQTSSKRMMFWDNCGTWDTTYTSTKTTHFIEQPNGDLKSCVLKNGLYCTEIKKTVCSIVTTTGRWPFIRP